VPEAPTSRVARGAELVHSIEEVYVCEVRAPRPSVAAAQARHAMLEAQLDALFGGRPRRSVTTASTGTIWSVRFDRFPCGNND